MRRLIEYALAGGSWGVTTTALSAVDQVCHVMEERQSSGTIQTDGSQSCSPSPRGSEGPRATNSAIGRSGCPAFAGMTRATEGIICVNSITSCAGMPKVQDVVRDPPVGRTDEIVKSSDRSEADGANMVHT